MAAFLPGTLLGGLSLIFKDITEGLGCLLGGFCFAMWVMTLAPGGVSDNQTTRIIVICVLAGAAYALAFSHHTREPGLIVCTSFAGATVIVLGIDCFSKAGMKEFWLYIWNLNPLIFPLGTHTYPITRGMKVESAAIVIIAVCGAMSQMRLWKIIKKRRADRAEKRKRDEEARAIVDEERNAAFTERHNKDRKLWEREFGNKGGMDSESAFSQPGSSTYHSDDPSYQKSSASIRERDLNRGGVELTELSLASRRDSRSTTSTRRQSRDKGSVTTTEEPVPRLEKHRPKQSNPDTLKALEKISERPSENVSIHGVPTDIVSEDGSDGQSTQQWPLGPEVKPLPFRVPIDEESEDKKDEDDVQSLATAGETVQLDEVLHKPDGDKGPLAGRKLKRTSGPQPQSFNYGADIPHLDDARSSVAATLDGISSHDGSLPALSRSGTPLPGTDDQAGTKTYSHHPNRSDGDLAEQLFKKEDDTAPKTLEANRRHSSHLPGTLPESTLGSLANLSKVDDTKPNHDEEQEVEVPAIVATRARSVSGASENKRESKPAVLTRDALPGGESSTVHLYRTNEWAKHQASAEAPEADSVAPPSEEGVAVDYGREVAAPVNVNSLQQTAFAASKSKSGKARKMSSNNPYRKARKSQEASPHQSSSSLGRTKSGPAVPVYSSAKRSSGPQRSSSNPSGSNSNLLTNRNSSNNLLNQSVPESPMEDAGKQKQPKTVLHSSNPKKGADNLIKLREDQMKTRLSTMSFAQLPGAAAGSSSTVNSAGMTPDSGIGESPSSSTKQPKANAILEEEDDDGEDVPLAKRQAQLKRSSSQQPSQHYQLNRSFNPYHNPAAYNTVSANTAGHDSHQPQRGASVTAAARESRMAAWRSSTAQLPSAGATPGLKIEANRQHMLESQRKLDEDKAKKDMEKRMKENVMDQRMRSGDVTELHRKKLAQMQRQASKKAEASNSKP